MIFFTFFFFQWETKSKENYFIFSSLMSDWFQKCLSHWLMEYIKAPVLVCFAQLLQTGLVTSCTQPLWEAGYIPPDACYKTAFSEKCCSFPCVLRRLHGSSLQWKFNRHLTAFHLILISSLVIHMSSPARWDLRVVVEGRAWIAAKYWQILLPKAALWSKDACGERVCG